MLNLDKINKPLIRIKLYEINGDIYKVLRKELQSTIDDVRTTNTNSIHIDVINNIIMNVMEQTTIPLVCKLLNITHDEYEDIINADELADDNIHWEKHREIHDKINTILSYLGIKINTTDFLLIEFDFFNKSVIDERINRADALGISLEAYENSILGIKN